jgi:tellurite resistance protein TehA-like permease
LLGAGLFPALMIQALYLQRLTIHKVRTPALLLLIVNKDPQLPPASVVVSVFLPIGPCGQSAFALLQLARVGRNLQRATGRGIFLAGTEGAALTDAVSALSFVLAFLLFGLGAWWLALALITIGRTAMYGGFPFNMFAVLQKRQIKEY